MKINNSNLVFFQGRCLPENANIYNGLCTHDILSNCGTIQKKLREDKVDLMLSGHCHNGQIIPFNLFVKLQFKYIYGFYTYNNSNLYISSFNLNFSFFKL